MVTPQWERRLIGKRRKKEIYWFCTCTCGGNRWVYSGSLTSGATTSCGCLYRETRSRRLIHGHAKSGSRSSTYRSWQAMWTRTTNRKQRSAYRYVKRGITVDPRWKSFECFLADMGERPPGKTLHRTNNNFGYSRQNCEWADAFKQARNTCHTKLTFQAAVEIALRVFRGERHKIIADDYAVSKSLPGRIARGKCWRDAFLKAKGV